MGVSPETFTPDVPQTPPPAPAKPAPPVTASEASESEPPPDLEEADFYATQGMFDEAIGIYRRALRGKPDDEALLARLDELLRASAGGSPAGQAVTTPITEVRRSGEVTRGFDRVAASEEPPRVEGEEIVSLDDEEVILDQPSSEEAPLDRGGFDLPMETPATESAPLEEEPCLEKPEWIEERQPAVAEVSAAGAPSVEENDFDLRAELEDESPEQVGEDGGVSAATEALSKLVEELQSMEEEEVPGGPEAQTHYDLGIAYKEMGLLDDAIRELRIASRDPKRWLECRTVLGICYREQGEAEEAIKEFEECLGDPRVTGHDPTALFYEMALAHEEAGQPEDALQCHQRAAEIDPEFRDVQKRIAALGGKKGTGRKGGSRAHRPEGGGKPEPVRHDSKKKISYL
jgi:tetratricopeptide (TPR) repeat protein